MRNTKHGLRWAGSFVAGVVGLALVAGCATAGTPSKPLSSSTVVSDLAAIASEHGNHRSTGSAGAHATRNYIVDKLDAYNLKSSVQSFRSPKTKVRGYNITADVNHGASGKVVLVGAHYDSVKQGPGIVDNASGVAAVLEMASRLTSSHGLKDTVRVAFWDSEENGVEGSAHYVKRLDRSELRTIKAYVNVDMAAAKGGTYELLAEAATIPGMADSGADLTAIDAAVAKSAPVTDAIRASLPRGTKTSSGFSTVTNSDAAPFAAAGIPADGFATMALETHGDELLFIPCYHQACDDMANVDRTLLKTTTNSVLKTVHRLAA